MPIIYRDVKVAARSTVHPAYGLNEEDPTYKMVRFADPDNPKKSVFQLTETQALDLARYYWEGYVAEEVVDEFGDNVWDFKKILENSFFMETKKKVSSQTIKELYDCWKVERELLKDQMNEKKEAA